MSRLETVFFGAGMPKLEKVIYVLGLALFFVGAIYVVTNRGRTDDAFLVWFVAVFAVGMAIRLIVRRKASV